MKTYTVDNLQVKIMPDRAEMGAVAAADIRERMLALLAEKETINMIFAAAPSQSDALAALCAFDDIDWSRVNAYHMDEYIGLPKEAPQGFGNFLMRHLFGKLPFRSVNLIDCSSTAEAECARYSGLLADNPPDIVVMGIGENGHIAFNDPPVADFNDPALVKVVELDIVCRTQQVHDGCFERLDQVPTHALTLTCPVLANAPWKFCVVPAPTKANAVRMMLEGPVSEACPCTILRRVDNAVLYLDGDSSALLK